MVVMSSAIYADVWSAIGRNWAAVAIAATCFSLALFTAMVLAKYVRICLNIFSDTPPPLSMGPLDFERLAGEVVRFRSFDGMSLRGMHIQNPDRSRYQGSIVFCHEYGSDMYSCARYMRPLLQAGFDIFTFDFRGHGESSNTQGYKPLQWPSDKELGDVLGACAYVETVLAAEGKPASIGIFGISRGAGSALLAAAGDPNIKAIVCDGAFDTSVTLVGLMKRWAYIFARVKLIYQNHPDSFWSFLLWLMMRFAQPKMGCKYPSVLRALKEMKPRPILFIHGQRDSYIRQDQTLFLHQHAAGEKYLWIVEGAKHNQAVIVQPQRYAERTVSFFQRHLAGQDVPDHLIADTPSVSSEKSPALR